MDTFGSRLRSLRQKKGLTQRELAKLIGAKHNSIYRYWKVNASYVNVL